MTSKIRRRLVYKYTAIIAVMLAFFAIAGFAMCKYAVKKVLADTIFDALSAEIREAESEMLDLDTPLEEIPVTSEINTIYSYSYWFVGDKLVFAEYPHDPYIDKLTREKVLAYDQERKIEQFSIWDEKEKEWQFSILSGKTANGRVVILINTSPFRLLSMRYTYLVLAAFMFMLIVAWIAGNFLADRTIAPLIKMLENQKRFVSDASHELRTPLAVLLSSIELLELKNKEPQLVAGMKEEVLGMSSLIGNLLELTRADNRRLAVKKENIDVKNFVARLFDKINKDKKFLFENRCPEGVEVFADKELLKRLLTILLDNAIKYSSEGAKIEVCAKSCDKNTQIEVRDEGIGIDEKDIDHIFERFYRADKTRSRQQVGTGLGLSIAKEIAELHNGTICVKSRLGKGSVFVVKLPNN